MELLHKLLIRMIRVVLSLVGGLFANHDWPMFNFIDLKLELLEILAILAISVTPAVVHYATGGLRWEGTFFGCFTHAVAYCNCIRL